MNAFEPLEPADGAAAYFATYRETEGGYLDWSWALDDPSASGGPKFVDTRWPEFHLFPRCEAAARAGRLAAYAAREARHRLALAATGLRHGDNGGSWEDW